MLKHKSKDVLTQLSDIDYLREKVERERAVRNGAHKLAETVASEILYLEALKAMHIANQRVAHFSASLQNAKLLAQSKRFEGSSSSRSPRTDVKDNSNSSNSSYFGQLQLTNIQIPVNYSRAFIDEAIKRHQKKLPNTRLAVFISAKLMHDKQIIEILDTELKCIPPNSQSLDFDQIIKFDQVPHDFTMELDLWCLPMSETPVTAENNKKLVKLLVKRHKIIDDVLRESEKQGFLHDNKFGGGKSNPLRNSFKKRVKSKVEDNFKPCLEKQDWINIGRAIIDLNAVKEVEMGGQKANLQLFRSGNMLHRFLPVSSTLAISIGIRPACFDNIRCQSYVNYYDEASSIGPPTWKYMYADVIGSEFRLWNNVNHRTESINNLRNRTGHIIRPYLAIDLTCPEIKVSDVDSMRARRPNSIVIRDFVTRHMISFGENSEKISFLNSLRKHRRELKIWEPILHRKDLNAYNFVSNVMNQAPSHQAQKVKIGQKQYQGQGLPTIEERSREMVTSMNSSNQSHGSSNESGSAMRLLEEKGYIDQISPRSRKMPKSTNSNVITVTTGPSFQNSYKNSPNLDVSGGNSISCKNTLEYTPKRQMQVHSNGQNNENVPWGALFSSGERNVVITRNVPQKMVNNNKNLNESPLSLDPKPKKHENLGRPQASSTMNMGPITEDNRIPIRNRRQRDMELFFPDSPISERSPEKLQNKGKKNKRRSRSADYNKYHNNNNNLNNFNHHSPVQTSRGRSPKKINSRQQSPYKLSRAPNLNQIQENSNSFEESQQNDKFTPQRKAPPVPRSNDGTPLGNPQDEAYYRRPSYGTPTGKSSSSKSGKKSNNESPMFEAMIEEYKMKTERAISRMRGNKGSPNKQKSDRRRSRSCEPRGSPFVNEKLKGKAWASPANNVLNMFIGEDGERKYNLSGVGLNFYILEKMKLFFFFD